MPKTNVRAWRITIFDDMLGYRNQADPPKEWFYDLVFSNPGQSVWLECWDGKWNTYLEAKLIVNENVWD